MSGEFDLHVCLQGGIHDLTKAMSVMAWMSLTPRTLTCVQNGEGLDIYMRLSAPPGEMELLAARLRNLIQIAAVKVAPVSTSPGQKV